MRFAQAKIDEWLFWEQYSHEPYIATTRYHIVYLKRTLDQREAWRVERGEAALDLMDRSLAGRSWLAGEAMTIADIALLAYTRLAHEGGFDLALARQRAGLDRALRGCAGTGAGTSCAVGGIGVANGESLDDEPVVHVLGIQRRAAGELRGRDDHAVVYVQLVSLGQGQAAARGCRRSEGRPCKVDRYSPRTSRMTGQLQRELAPTRSRQTRSAPGR